MAGAEGKEKEDKGASGGRRCDRKSSSGAVGCGEGELESVRSGAPAGMDGEVERWLRRKADTGAVEDFLGLGVDRMPRSRPERVAEVQMRRIAPVDLAAVGRRDGQ